MAKNSTAKVTFVAETEQFSEGIKSANKALSNLRSDLKVTNSALKANGDNFEDLTDKSKLLNQAMKENADKIGLLEKKLDACKKILGENSDEYQKIYKQLNNAKTAQNNFQRELKDTEKALDKLGDSAKDTAKDIDKLNDEMDNSGGFMEGFADAFNSADVSAVGLGTALGNLASGAISLCIDAISEFCQYLWELPEATQEFRMQMAKLSGATQQYGYDMEFTNELVKEMYGYLGDEQMAVNAITNLQGMGLAQSDLTNTLNSCIAVWTAYGDSIPIESLTESVNETAQVGKVTGVLADALNWAGISEDEFNKKLEACKTTQERATLITQTLNDAYGDSKTKFDQATAGMREAEEASYDLMQAEAELAEQIGPLTTKFTELKTEGLASISPVLGDVADSLLEIIDAIERFKKTNAGQMFSDLGGAFMDFMYWTDELWAGLKKLYEILKPVFDYLGELISYMGNFYSVIKDGGSVMEAFEYANSRAWTTTKEEMIEGGQVSESTFNNMKRQAEQCGDGIASSMKDATDKSSQSYQEFENKAKGNLNNVGNHKVTLQTPNTSPAEQALVNYVNKGENRLNTFESYNYSVASPDFTKANGGVATGISAIQTKLNNLNGKTWNIKSPNSNVDVSGAISNIQSKLSSASFTVKVKGILSSIAQGISSVSMRVNYKGGIAPDGGFLNWHYDGAIITKPTVFNTPLGLQGVGDRYKGMGSNAEAILPLDSFYRHLDDKLDSLSNTGDVIVSNNQFIINNEMDIERVAEQLAFYVKRKSRF